MLDTEISDKFYLFLHHSLAPIGVGGSYFVSRWISKVIVKRDLIAEFRFGDTTLGPSLHGVCISRDNW